MLRDDYLHPNSQIPAYAKLFEHTMWITGAMDRIGENEADLWDEDDGFFYDLLRLPNGEAVQLKVRSMVGLLTLMAVAVFPTNVTEHLPRSDYGIRALSRYHQDHPYCFYHTGQESGLTSSRAATPPQRHLLRKPSLHKAFKSIERLGCDV